ncbi:hypothetical protein J3E72DRAFT_380328 [Bipolaris maydis]|nr:hypothetical protein J3E72DRAFT_380395 [Bipolaris maydis]KAJ6191951.1 hypothetical protein J3E72DRAFT_380420 [Bipolaris maydis]KAJ6191952.1 hypothetical protein J3E72DRAFT_380328 [Bipolaris maydis]KAJ6276522.1 hypothetical protein J3E71DRAFT_187165 [Bipolaris maydis]
MTPQPKAFGPTSSAATDIVVDNTINEPLNGVSSTNELAFTNGTTTTTILSQNTTLACALRVLTVEAAAITHAAQLYTNSVPVHRMLLAAVNVITGVHAHGGKVVVCGIGKSGHIGGKLVATLNSLGVSAAFLHAAEAVHGDLGVVRDVDVLLFVSSSGGTGELLNVLPHVASQVPIIALTGHADASACPLLVGRKLFDPDLGKNEEQGGGHKDGKGIGILLPTPVHESEEQSFGVGAPTTSTIVTMAVGDMLAVAVSEKIYGAEKAHVFQRNHPGGVLGTRVALQWDDNSSDSCCYSRKK